MSTVFDWQKRTFTDSPFRALSIARSVLNKAYAIPVSEACVRVYIDTEYVAVVSVADVLRKSAGRVTRTKQVLRARIWSRDFKDVSGWSRVPQLIETTLNNTRTLVSGRTWTEIEQSNCWARMCFRPGTDKSPLSPEAVREATYASMKRAVK